MLTRNSFGERVHKARDSSNGQVRSPWAEPSTVFLPTASVYLHHRKLEQGQPQNNREMKVRRSSPSPPFVCQNHFRYPEAGGQVWVPCPEPQLTLTWHVVPWSPATVVLHQSCSSGEQEDCCLIHLQGRHAFVFLVKETKPLRVVYCMMEREKST